MGGAQSASVHISSHRSLKRSDAEVVDLMMPVYFTNDEPTHNDIVLARQSWKYILEDTSPEYLRLKALGGPNFEYNSCVILFYDTFYGRLFDVHPMCRPMFKKGIRTQGKFLVSMLSMILTDFDDATKQANSVNALSKLAEGHYHLGVKAIEYGIVGEVLFYAIRKCVGDEAFDEDTHLAWFKIFSRILRIVVPIAVELEMRGVETNNDRFEVRNEVSKRLASNDNQNA